ncbi:hypothetical protein LG3211_3159 [Lysobacter gummosus]|nr:hypothetical protein LG3211_3159 [Lysobacter gummosus]
MIAAGCRSPRSAACGLERVGDGARAKAPSSALRAPSPASGRRARFRCFSRN